MGKTSQEVIGGRVLIWFSIGKIDIELRIVCIKKIVIIYGTSSVKSYQQKIWYHHHDKYNNSLARLLSNYKIRLSKQSELQ